MRAFTPMRSMCASGLVIALLVCCTSATPPVLRSAENALDRGSKKAEVLPVQALLQSNPLISAYDTLRAAYRKPLKRHVPGYTSPTEPPSPTIPTGCAPFPPCAPSGCQQPCSTPPLTQSVPRVTPSTFKFWARLLHYTTPAPSPEPDPRIPSETCALVSGSIDASSSFVTS